MAAMPTAMNEPPKVDAAPVKGAMGDPVGVGGETLNIGLAYVNDERFARRLTLQWRQYQREQFLMGQGFQHWERQRQGRRHQGQLASCQWRPAQFQQESQHQGHRHREHQGRLGSYQWHLG